MPWYDNSWGYRLKVTVQSSKVDADLTDFPVYVNLSDIGSGHGFWTNVKSDGGDIRITKSDETTEVAREVVAIDTTGKTGEIHFLADGTLSSSSNTEYWIYYGNAGASEPATTATYGRDAVWADYRAVYHFEADATDSTGNGNDGTVNFATNGAAKIEDGYYFDGNDDIDIGTNSSLNFTTCTASLWLNSDETDITTNRNIYNRKNGTRAGTWALVADSITDKVFMQFRLEGSEGSNTKVFANSAVSGGWEMIHARYDGTNANLFVDGVQQTDSASASGALYNSGSLVDFDIGQHPTAGAHWLGDVDEVRFRSGGLSNDWISTEYNNQNSSSTFYTIGAEESAPAGGTSTLIIID